LSLRLERVSNPFSNCIRMILRALELEDVIVASGLASVQAVEQIVEETPNALVIIDEVGALVE
jgi:hypothetical protein